MRKDLFEEVAAIVMTFNDQHTDAGQLIGLVLGGHRSRGLSLVGGCGSADVLQAARGSEGGKGTPHAPFLKCRAEGCSAAHAARHIVRLPGRPWSSAAWKEPGAAPCCAPDRSIAISVMAKPFVTLGDGFRDGGQ
jgi:hypothetical protein